MFKPTITETIHNTTQTTMQTIDLPKILKLHKLWLEKHPEGRRAYLRGADLSGADLRGADLRGAYLSSANLRGADLSGAYLRGADLSGANLRDADLREARGVRLAACHWTAHGERGRLLNAVEIEGEVTFFCGCFQGNERSLREYISMHNPEHASSRTKALEFLLSCF